MKITVAGVGYVGLSLAVLLAQNHEVTAITTTEAKAEKLNKFISPIQDDEIERFFQEAREGSRKLNLHTTTDKESAYGNAELVIIATPTNYDDEHHFFDTSAVEDAIEWTLKVKRDFTYIDDIVEGVYRVMQGAPEKANGEDGLPLPAYAVYNIGGGTPENLLDYVSTLQEELVRAGVLPEDYDFEAHRELVPMQLGDVPVTYADSKALEDDYGFRPTIGIREGLGMFAEWYKGYKK